MASDDLAQKLRGERTLLPSWWLDRANECWKLWKSEVGGLQSLADALTEAYGRELNGKPWKWDRKTVERFLENESPTRELMEAFCKLFPDVLIPPTYVAESEDEAMALANVASGFRAAGYSKEATRKRSLVETREAIEQRVRDQIERLKSHDEAAVEGREGVPSDRRPRGVGRGRSSSSSS